MISTNTSCWRQQFVDALKVIDDDEDDDDDDDDADKGPPREPTSVEYLVHFLSVFWKVLFATVPPTEMFNGWPCFVVSIFWIGVLTAVVGDVASHVGCTIGMKVLLPKHAHTDLLKMKRFQVFTHTALEASSTHFLSSYILNRFFFLSFLPSSFLSHYFFHPSLLSFS